VIGTVDAEEERHESDVDEDTTVSVNEPSTPVTAAAAKTPAFRDNDTSSEVAKVFCRLFGIFL